MARFHPSTPPDGSPNSELRVRDALRALSDEWNVFHQVRWQGLRDGRQGDGEADFILLHPQHGVVVLEVKGGRVVVVDGRWFTTDRYDETHEIKNPFVQATASKHALLAFMRNLFLSPPRICHATVFPDVVLATSIGLQPREIVVDASDLPRCDSAIDRVLRHWGQYASSEIASTEVDQLVRMLAPTLFVRHHLRASIANAEADIIQLTNVQIGILSNLRRVRRCVISGGAGTGKTLLAAEKARQILAVGGAVLVVCFNAPLAEKLRSDLADTNAHVRTFHALCMEICRSAKRPLPRELTDQWWSEDAARELVAATHDIGIGNRFDAVLVDEAQDFRGEWLSALDALARNGNDAFVYLFADPHQCLFHRQHVLPTGWPMFELNENCRNTEPISSAAAHAIGDLGSTSRIAGRAVAFIEADGTGVPGVVQSVVDRLLSEESIPAADVAVLVDASSVQNRLRTMTAGDCCFVDMGESGIQVDTIRRFKGLESPVVVLALSNAPSVPSDDWRALLYVGVSRARTFLVVVGPRRVKDWLGLPA